MSTALTIGRWRKGIAGQAKLPGNIKGTNGRNQNYSYEEFRRVQNAPLDKYKKLALIADMNPPTRLREVKRAGSGHLGSSFSAMDIILMAIL
ncbi:MAG: hypothetical protein U0V48_11480 [Anaerolineales bacterium]